MFLCRCPIVVTSFLDCSASKAGPPRLRAPPTPEATRWTRPKPAESRALRISHTPIGIGKAVVHRYRIHAQRGPRLRSRRGKPHGTVAHASTRQRPKPHRSSSIESGHALHLLSLSVGCARILLSMSAPSTESPSVALAPRSGHSKAPIRKAAVDESPEDVVHIPDEPGNQPNPLSLYLSCKPITDTATEQDVNSQLSETICPQL